MFTGSVGTSGWFDMTSNFGKKMITLLVSLGGLAVFLLIFLILPPIGRQYSIPSTSMAPSIMDGDIIYASNYAYSFSEDKVPQRGDIITFRPSPKRSIFIKRVIGLPGDKVQIRGGRLYLNDNLIERTSKGIERLHLNFKREAESYSLYEEPLASDIQPYQIFEKSDTERLDNTVIFTVPKGLSLIHI